MKTLVSVLVALAASILPARAQESIRPIVAPGFGQPVTVRAEFVAKANTYYDQNMVSEPYTLRVVAVNGHALPEPVLVEYNLHAEKKQRAELERAGVVSTFEAYETLHQPGTATPWLDGEQGMPFALVHVLHIRPPQTKNTPK